MAASVQLLLVLLLAGSAASPTTSTTCDAWNLDGRCVRGGSPRDAARGGRSRSGGGSGRIGGGGAGGGQVALLQRCDEVWACGEFDWRVGTDDKEEEVGVGHECQTISPCDGREVSGGNGRGRCSCVDGCSATQERG